MTLEAANRQTRMLKALFVLLMCATMLTLLFPLAFRALASTNSAAKTPVASALKSGKKLSGVRICLDPGHQKKADRATEKLAPWSKEPKARTSSGTQGASTKTPEYVYTLEFSKKLESALEDRGANVKLTRTGHDVKLSNIERAEIGNDFDSDVVLRIHCDGSENPKKQGIGMFVGKTADSAAKSKQYATALLRSMLKYTGAKSAGVHASDNYTGMNWSDVPSILVELGYMSNAEEDKRLATDAYQQQLIDGIVGWCLDEFGK